MKKSALLVFCCVVLSVSASYFVIKNHFNGLVYTHAATGEPYKVSAVNSANNMLLTPDFVKASEASIHSVVYIKTITRGSQQRNYWDLWDLFGNNGPVSASGSGVIVTDNGYIVTNNHVIEGADQIEVILNKNKRSYNAKVIGREPNADLAVLKIEASGLDKINFANSEDLKIGEWVLAVGNPFNLTSTVTAGIVSAKGRNINIVTSQFPIESFIQTDAAINPGNSGGALVNINGELVGINTAIYSQTGSYNGYGFAIPSNIVAKIIKDIRDFGEVQRAFTGMNVEDIDAMMLEKIKENIDGVYVSVILTDGPAAKSGIQEGDIIQKINGKNVFTKAEFDEQIAYMRPGDIAKISIWREGKVKDLDIKLVNKNGNTEITKKQTVTSEILGADIEQISKVEREKYNVKNGFRITNIKSGRIRQMNLPEGFIVVALNRNQYSDIKEFISDFEKVQGQISIQGINPQGSFVNYSFLTR